MTAGNPLPRAVTFDFWNTLVAETGTAAVVARWVDHFSELGVDVGPVAVEAAWGAGWDWFQQRWHTNRPPSTREVVEATVAALDLPPDHDCVEGLVAIAERGADPDEIRPAPGIADTLEALRSAGVRVGIICDVGRTPSPALRTYLSHHGLLGYFDHWSFSDEVGCFKPDPAIFKHAAVGLGRPDPASTVHVGDLRRTDVVGARAAGWASVRYRGLHDDADEANGAEADHVVDHHGQLPGLLGLS